MSVYSDRDIKKLIEQGSISSNSQIDNGQIQPGSLDLTLGDKIYCMPYSSINSRGLENFLKNKNEYETNLDENTFLHKNTVYVAELNESLNLPENIYSKANPKSSTGRIDAHVRLLTENGNSFDDVSRGYRGKLFLEIYSASFNLRVPPKISLNQIRFFEKGTSYFNASQLEELANSNPLIFDKEGNKNPSKSFQRELMHLSIDLESKTPGYVSRHDAPTLDLSRRDNPKSHFFDKVGLIDDGIIIAKDSFYLFNTSEIVNIPAGYCAEMPDILTTTGEFRAHYAGFFDPGFNAAAVAEVRNLGAPYLIRDKQRIAALVFSELTSSPLREYGKEIKSNYQGQEGVKVAKYFDETK